MSRPVAVRMTRSGCFWRVTVARRRFETLGVGVHASSVLRHELPTAVTKAERAEACCAPDGSVVVTVQ